MIRRSLHADRRSVLGAVAGLAAAAATSRPASARTGAAMPNILWIVSEDNNPFIGAYGDSLAHTPVLDGLASQGILYRNVFSNAPVCAPSRFGILTGVYPESCSPAQHMRAKAHLPGFLRTYPELMREAGYFCTNNAKTDYNCDVDPTAIWDRDGKQAHWRDRPAGQPFLSIFNYETTHESRLFQPTPGRVGPQDVKVPGFVPDLPEVRADYASYYNLMERMDAQLGERLAELEADGLAEDTIVFYYSDNGGTLPRSKRYCYDEGLRCAMIVRLPAKWAHLAPVGPGAVIDDPVSFIDLAPTLLSLAGRRSPGTMQGRAFLGKYAARPARYAFGMRNRMDERYDFVRTVTDGRWRYIRNYMPHRPNGQHQAFEWLAKGYQAWETAWRDGRCDASQSRFFETKPYEELYDLSADPDELQNLAGDERSARHLSRLSAALDAHMVAINDNGFIPEGAPVEGYEQSRMTGAYPLAALMKLGTLAAGGKADALPSLVAAMTHPNAVMRYWAATGLLVQGSKAAPAIEALTRMMTGDPCVQARIVAAEAVARLQGDRAAVAILAALLDAGQPVPIRLQAINALTYVSPVLAGGVLPQITAARQDASLLVANAATYLEAVLVGTYTPSMKIFDIDALRKAGKGGEG